jgi:hypothetical protein
MLDTVSDARGAVANMPLIVGWGHLPLVSRIVVGVERKES